MSVPGRNPVPHLRAPLAGVLLAALLSAACSETAPEAPTSPGGQPSVLGVGQELVAAIAAQERHTPGLMRLAGVLGSGVGLDEDGSAVVRVYAIGEGVEGIPRRLDGVPVQVEITGMFVAGDLDDPTTKERPAPNGFSIGHPSITAGTLGALVTRSNTVYILSNNHVLANSNDASPGDAALQPGPFDGGTSADRIGTLAEFVPIDFSGGDNTVDAAIASVLSGADVTGATPDYAYGAPGTSPLTSFNPGLDVQKFGRTTGHTVGDVAETNVTVDVCYETRGPLRCVRLARFVGQFTIAPGSFSDGGDSGSLIVTNDGNKRPVGLLFAGSSSRTIANPIGPVLSAFGASITTDPGDGGEPPPPPPPGDFTLAATGYKVRGLQTVDLEWSGATSTDVDVRRNGSVVATTPNDGFHTDAIGVRGGGTYTYQVCEAGTTTTCSNEATIVF